MRTLLTTFALAAATLAAPSYAAPLTASQIMTQFNGVFSGDFATNSDVEGRLVANNISHGATFYNNPSNSASAFAAVNAITVGANGGGNVLNHGSVNYITSNAGSFGVSGGGTIQQAAPAFAMSDFTAPLDALSGQLHGMASANGTLNTDPNNFDFHTTGSGTSVFNLGSSVLATAGTIKVTGGAQTIIINVTWDGGALPTKTLNVGGNFNDNANLGSHIIWNFVGVDKLNLNSWHGAILADGTTLAANSQLNGFIYAENYLGNGELHDHTAFTGLLPVPEPSTYAMLGVGLAALVLMQRRRQPAKFEQPA